MKAVILDDEKKAESAMRDLLASKKPATALFAAKSELGVGIIRSMHSAKRTDIAMISFDDFRLADTIQPAISILDHSSRDLARAAMTRLLSKIDGVKSPVHEEILPLSVIERGSGELKPA